MRSERFLIVLLAAGLYCLASYALADWSPAQRLTWTLGTCSSPAAAVDLSNTLHVVWTDDTPGNTEVYYKRTTDGGTTWTGVQRMTWTTGDSNNPALAVDSSNTIHLVWNDDTPGIPEIYYRRSVDNGATWSVAQRLTWSSGYSFYPTIATDSTSGIYVVWYDDTPGVPEVYYKRSTNGGTTWDALQRLTWTSGWSEYSAIAVDSGNTIHVVWDDYTPGDPELYYKRSTNGGTTWSAAQRLTWTSASSYSPSLAADSGNVVHVVWFEQAPGIQEIYYKRGASGGTTWGSAQRLTWTPGGSAYPALAVDSGNAVHAVWQDPAPGNLEIYYKRSSDGGTTWGAAQRLTYTSGLSYTPAIAIDSANAVYVVWNDSTPGNYEIYYKKGT